MDVRIIRSTFHNIRKASMLSKVKNLIQEYMERSRNVFELFLH